MAEQLKDGAVYYGQRCKNCGEFAPWIEDPMGGKGPLQAFGGPAQRIVCPFCKHDDRYPAENMGRAKWGKLS